MGDDFYNTYEVKKATSDISDLKDDMKQKKLDDAKMNERIGNIEKEQALQGQKLDTIIKKQAEQSRMIQQAIYGAVATGVIGGLIALVWSQLGGGG